jgi:hypothetical protein
MAPFFNGNPARVAKLRKLAQGLDDLKGHSGEDHLAVYANGV